MNINRINFASIIN